MYPVVYGDSTPTRHRSDTRGPCLACLERTATEHPRTKGPTYWLAIATIGGFIAAAGLFVNAISRVIWP